MDAELKAKWLDALRSGRYIRGTGQLRETVDGVTRHCALGVLAEEAGVLHSDGLATTWDIEHDRVGFDWFRVIAGFEPSPVYISNDSVGANVSDYDDIIPYIEENL